MMIYLYGNEEAFKVKDKYKYKQRKCYTCGKPNHISKNGWFREENKINKPKQFEIHQERNIQKFNKPLYKNSNKDDRE